jgi:squalene-associated FAD-dependent desaturase
MTAKMDVVIAGAGLAGLAAAVRLADLGARVTVLERSPVPGGRVRRMTPRGGGREAIDFGQHLMLGCYRQARAMAAMLGTADLLHDIVGITPFVSESGAVHPYRSGNLPAPLHALPGLLHLTHLGMADRLRLGLAAVAAKADVRFRAGALDGISALEWLRRNGQGSVAVNGFWGPLCIATLNMAPEHASALLFATVIDKALLAGREDAVPMLPRTTLHDVFIGPAISRVIERGGQVVTGARVVRVVDGPSGRIRALATSKGDEWQAGSFILAVPNWDIAEIVRGVRGLAGLALMGERLESSPIITVELWFDRHWMKYPFAGLVGSQVQWLFDHAQDPATRQGRGFRVSAVISDAGGQMGSGRDELVNRCLDQVCRYFPEARGVRLNAGEVIKAHKATFRGRPGQDALRPPGHTAWGNLFLAGDWTATGLPATIEGAVASGFRAAGLAKGSCTAAEG